MLRLGIAIVVCLLAVCPLRGGEGMPAMLRRPMALALDESESWLFAANRRSGTISVIDCERREAVEEIAVGERLADLALMPGGQRLLTLDEARHELTLLSGQGANWQVDRRLAVRPYPVCVAVAADGSRAFIASLWSRSLSVVALEPPAQAEVVKTLPLEFAPRKLLLAGEAGKLIVADAFGGKLAVVGLTALEVERVVEIPGHNIRGLALDRERRKLLVSHQILDASAETTRQNVHWGAVLTDVARWIELDSLLAGREGQPLESHVHQFGDEEGAGGDPAEAVVTSDGTLIQALAGVGKLAIGREWESDRARILVGRRPTDVVVDGAGRLAYVADAFGDAFGDAIVAVDVREAKKLATISLGPQRELELADRGELLFYDARLSLDGWYSCHSCHTDGHTNGLLNDNLGDGSYGAPKRVLSLLGVGDTGPWAWNGAVTSLESQIRKSIESTMQGRQPSEEQVTALAAYLRTLGPPPALGAMSGQQDENAIDRGRKTFDSRGCANCHVPPTYASPEIFDVGLKDESGATRFNPPSLRGVSQRAPYFHDNRAATLDAVFREYQHPRGSRYSDDELRDLPAFLESL